MFVIGSLLFTLKVRTDLKATDWLTESLTDKVFVTISQSRGTSSVLSMESYQYAFSTLSVKHHVAMTNNKELYSVLEINIIHLKISKIINHFKNIF